MLHRVKCFVFVLLLLVATIQAGAQNDIYHQSADISARYKVMVGGNRQSMPWAGGANNPQFAGADLNRDGKSDLVIYEQLLGIRTFLNTGTAGSPVYVYAPEYETYFPEVKNYMLMLDCNQDGVQDLFHYGSAGIAVCKGYYNSDNKLTFQQAEDLKYTVGSSIALQTINVNNTDIPGIADVDNDGDIDIVTFFQWGAYLYYYKNMQVEQGLPASTFKLKLADQCWGKIFQDVYRTHILGYTCNNSNLRPDPSLKATHGANTVCLFDYDGDGDMDYLNGNSVFPDAQMLKNGRVEHNYVVDTMVSQDTLWSATGGKLYMPNYPAAFWLDVDGDGDKDLLFSPHARGSENYRCIAYYKNTGSASSPVYTYQSDTFLIDQMMDFGTGAYPVLYDYNRDGKLDLFVGNQGYYQSSNGTFRSRIAYYQNTATGSSDISFTLITKDYLNLSTLNITGAIPAIGDIDGDGKDDLLIGKLDGKLLYFHNQAATAAAIPDWQQAGGNLTDDTGAEVSVGGFAAPCIYDIDKDGHEDIILGNWLGTLVYYHNNGFGTFKHITDTLGGVKTAPALSTYGYSVPFIGKIDNTGTEYLLLGSQTGELYRYDGFQNGNTTGIYTRLDSVYSNIKVKGEYTAPTVADLDGDGKYEMIIGNVLGGLYLYSQLFNSNIPTVPQAGTKLTLYPNPVTNEAIVATIGLKSVSGIRLYNSIGQQQAASYTIGSDNIRINTAALSSGIYMLTVYTAYNVYTASFVKQ